MGSHVAPRSQRQLRVGEVLRHALSEYFSRNAFGDLSDAASLTISEVKVSPDLRNASVFVMPLGGKNLDRISQALNEAKASIRYQIASIVKLRYMPQLEFKTDSTFDQVDQIEALLRDPIVEQDTKS